jgi:2-polyprenyl-3-methyl-5-hydroxy-6-metoxy-1,4-benzoquinol methylase
MVERIHTGKIIDEANGYKILDCIKCKFIHAVASQTIDVYTSHYYDEEKPNYITANESETEWWDLTYGARIDYADDLAGKSLKSWIDIGTGPGLFLDAANKRNKEIIGVEPSLQAYTHAMGKGHRVVNGFFDSESSLTLGSFDAAHFSEVLEHVPDPEEFLLNVRNVVKSDGLIVIVVPNDYNLLQQAYIEKTGKVKWWLAPPFHLNYFSHDSLSCLVERCGFEILECTSMFPIDLFLLMGDDYIGNDEIAKKAHSRRKVFETNLAKENKDLLRELYKAFANLKIGREVVLYARKLGD